MEDLKSGFPIGGGQSFAGKVTKGLIWVMLCRICLMVLNLISAVILARLLDPVDFGLMAIAMSVIFVSQMVTTTGFQAALIQRQGDYEDFLNVAWTFEIIKFFLLSFIVFASAPLLAGFFRKPAAVPVLRAVAVYLVLQGLRNIGIVQFRKKLDFRRQFVFEIVPWMVYAIVSIFLAFVLRDVWALILGVLAMALTSCILSYVMHPYRPRLELEISRAKELFNFGKWILGTSILVTLQREGVVMFVGRILNMSMLGFYDRAVMFSDRLFQQLVQIVWKIGYPAYSEIQSDNVKFRQAYMETLKFVAFIGMPMAGGMFILIRDFTHLFLTDKWMPIVPVVRMLCLQAVFMFINTPAGILFSACGRPSVLAKISFARIIILAVLIYPASCLWGLSGIAFSLFLSISIPSPVIWYMTMKAIRLSLPEFAWPVILPLLNTLFMSTVILFIKAHVLHYVGIAQFAGLILSGAVLYFGTAYLLDKCTGYGMYGLIKKRVTALKS